MSNLSPRSSFQTTVGCTYHISCQPDKSSTADPLPVSLLKLVTEEIAPFLTELFNRSMSAGHFPAVFKDAFITPALKKPLDVTNVQSYWPISNLSVVSKILEWVGRQLNNYHMSANLLPTLQSGFRPGHSTETAFSRYSQTFWRLPTTVILLVWL